MTSNPIGPLAIEIEEQIRIIFRRSYRSFSLIRGSREKHAAKFHSATVTYETLLISKVTSKGITAAESYQDLFRDNRDTNMAHMQHTCYSYMLHRHVTTTCHSYMLQLHVTATCYSYMLQLHVTTTRYSHKLQLHMQLLLLENTVC